MTDTTLTQEPVDDIRPIVGEDRGNRPLWLGLGAILLVGFLLFLMLETRRQSASTPAVRASASDLSISRSAVPPLYVPPDPIAVRPPLPPLTSSPAPLAASTPQPRPATARPSSPTDQPINVAATRPPLPLQPIAVTPAGPAIVYDNISGGASEVVANAPPTATSSALATASRARAGRVANSATIVPQGTLISAVLETALDSTQPGQTRALVSRDVVNLRGDSVLIPRGSRLYGSYRGELASGQKRTQIEWTRLVRPDGVTIAIDSPAADRLGRAGVRGRVNTYFLERLSGALLQTSIGVGGALATRSIGGDTVVVALPGSVQGATSQLVQAPPKPTLRVRQGTRISVFVSRDLDFTGVEPRK